MRRKEKVALYLAVFLISLLASREVAAMFGLGKTCVFSAVKVQLTRNGEPLRGVKVIRRWDWNELKEDTTTTDEDGRFEFPAIFDHSITRLLPVELVIGQGLYVIEDGEEKQIWANSKREPEENAEFNGRAIRMSCEMTKEMRIHKEPGLKMWTLCEWGD